MDINIVKNAIDFGISTQSEQTTSRSKALISQHTSKTGDVEEQTVTPLTKDKDKRDPADLQEVTEMTEAMNKFVQAMNAQIQFTVHDGTHQLMVQVVDHSTNTVIKEFPSSEFLDTIAAIRDYVGILLDEKI